MENGDDTKQETTEVENQENIEPTAKIDIKVTPVTKLQEEVSLTPVSSAGEDDDTPDFQDMLKDDPAWIPPPAEVSAKIKELLEHYFSDENLIKDKFLLKHVKRNKQGYVSVKLLTSFKKIKNLSKDWKMTAFAVIHSEKLEINRTGTKLRRKDPLPEINLPTTSIKTILYKLGDGQEEPSLDKVSEKFREYGALTTIRIIRPMAEVPNDLRNHMTKHPELGQSLCVVVEFETTDAAQNAYKTLSKIAREEERTESYNLLGSGRNPRKAAGKNKDFYDSNDESPYTSSRENSPMVRRKFVTSKNGFQPNTRYSVSPLISPQGSRDTSPVRGQHDSRSPRGSPRLQRKNGGQGNMATGGPWVNRKGIRDSTPETSPRGSPRGSPLNARKQHPAQQKKSPLALAANASAESGSNNSTPTGSPWLQRRRMYVASQAANSPCGSPGTSPVLGRKFQDGVPEGVLRLPKGPPNINSKGFDGAWKRRAKTAEVVKALPDKPSPLVAKA